MSRIKSISGARARALRPAVAILMLGGLATASSTLADATDSSLPVVSLSAIDGRTTPTVFVLDVDVAGATEAKLIIDGKYVGKDVTLPLQFDVAVQPGDHKLKVRTVSNATESRVDAKFVAEGFVPSPTTTLPAEPTTVPATTAPATTAPVTTKPQPTTTLPAPTPTISKPTTTKPATTTTTTRPSIPLPTIPPPTNGEIVVNSVETIRAALAGAQPGAVIRILDGEYEFKPRLVASASGTASAPITLRGSRNAVIRTKNAAGDYGLHVLGDYWNIQGITVAHATKGIVLDGSVGTVIDGVEVYDIGDEGIHFRTCSSDGVLRNSYVHQTGQNSAQYGEGVYVGSANSNWSKYACVDLKEGIAKGDNTERVLIEDNVFEDITAEGADLKEGTDSGILRRNIFRHAGVSGMNSADSAIDAKGNNWIIEGNVVTDTARPWLDKGVERPSEFLDGLQSHSVYSGYGTGNVFRNNRVEGAIDGFGIGMYPALGNVVTCDNVADGAALGLVGNSSKPSSCR